MIKKGRNMNVNSISNFVEKHIASLGVKKNDNLVVHADITSFGIYHKKLLSIIIRILMKKIGIYGTIAFPLYNTTLDKKDIINLKKDYGKNENSILSSYFFKKYNPIKTSSIFHSHIVRGKLENKFKKNKNFESFGKNSDFDLFYRYSFKLLLLGCDASKGCTYLHHIENKKPKKYRKKKRFKLKIKLDKKLKKIDVNYSVRKKNILLNFNKIFFLPKVKKITKKSKLKFGYSYFVNIREFDQVCTNLINKNPKILLA